MLGLKTRVGGKILKFLDFFFIIDQKSSKNEEICLKHIKKLFFLRIWKKVLARPCFARRVGLTETHLSFLA